MGLVVAKSVLCAGRRSLAAIAQLIETHLQFIYLSLSVSLVWVRSYRMVAEPPLMRQLDSRVRG